jgi:hypothetical protein
MTCSPFLVIAMLLLPCSMASAEVTGACLSDAKAKCPGVEAGGGKIRECLKTNFKDLSDPCQEVVLKAVAVKACEADVKQLCAGVEPGEGRIEACMKAKKADISEACKAAIIGAVAGQD